VAAVMASDERRRPRIRQGRRRLRRPLLSSTILAVLLLPPVTARATEPMLKPIPPRPATSFETLDGARFDIAFGITGTTNYISRGITNSGNWPAIQGYVEPSWGPFYANVWSSNVDFGAGFEGAEIDTALGVRPEFGPLALDLGYVHYFYAPETVSPDYGELFLKADYNVGDMFTVVGRAFFAPDFNQSGKTATFVAGGVEVPLPHDFAVYGGIGYQFFEDPRAFEQLAWTAGVNYTWRSVTFDLRYWDTDLGSRACTARSGFSDGCDARVVLSVSLNSTLSALKELARP